MNTRRANLPARQRGAAIFVAIFLITVVVLAAALVALTSVTQHTGQARAGQAERAWYAALARIEDEVSGIITTDACPGASTQEVFGFETTLSCDRTEVNEGAMTYGVFSLLATARQGDTDSAIFVRRSVRAQITTGGS
jgi:hypothetical protein